MKKRHTLIIGGTRGMGRALVRLLEQEAHLISVISRRLPTDGEPHLPDVHYWSADLLDPERISEVLTEIIQKNGKLSNLVFFQRYRGEGDKWAGEIDTTLTATKNVIEHLVDDFDDADSRSIVIVGSVAVNLIAEEQFLSYHVAKAGISQMVRYYAATLGQKGIRVNCVSPGTVMKDESKDFYLQNEQLRNLYKKIIPLGRMGTAEEVANVIAFFCSPMASFVTGQNIIVDGGLSLLWQESLARKLIT